MSVRLLNRKRVEAPVSKFLELVALPPALCKCVARRIDTAPSLSFFVVYLAHIYPMPSFMMSYEP